MANFGPQFNAYGAVPGNFGPHNNAYGAATDDSHPADQLEAGLRAQLTKKAFQHHKRLKMTKTGTCVNLFFPWILFILVSADMTFGIHFYYPVLCWILAIIGVLVALAIGGLAAQKLQELFDGAPHPSPAWLIFLFLTSLIAAVSGIWIGDVNYWENMHAYYDIQSLNTYAHVDPQKNHGKQMMDAGLVNFVPNAKLDLDRAYKFDDFEQYCVAPVSVKMASSDRPAKLDYYDFWAVGLDCCPSNASTYADYRCGAFDDISARQGLRLMSENQRSFYKLAVEQATAAHHITSKYPIFFFWTADAKKELHGYEHSGQKYFWLSVFVWLGIQLLLFFWMSFLVSKFGY